jgi:hypothetical protein
MSYRLTATERINGTTVKTVEKNFSTLIGVIVAIEIIDRIGTFDIKVENYSNGAIAFKRVAGIVTDKSADYDSAMIDWNNLAL